MTSALVVGLNWIGNVLPGVLGSFGVSERYHNKVGTNADDAFHVLDFFLDC
jgi:hypothetical protein